jgi:hypothetical protein
MRGCNKRYDVSNDVFNANFCFSKLLLKKRPQMLATRGNDQNTKEGYKSSDGMSCHGKGKEGRTVYIYTTAAEWVLKNQSHQP